MSVLNFPVRHVDNNLVFAIDGTVTAYFKVAGFNYDFLSEDDKFGPFNAQRAMLYNNKYDLHYVSEPFPTDIEKIIESTMDDMKAKDYELKEYGLMYMEALREALAMQRANTEASDYHQYFGVQLNAEKKRFKETNVGLNAIQSIREFINGITQQTRRAMGLHATDVLESEIQMWQMQSDTLLESLRIAFRCRVEPVSTEETIYLLEKEFSVMQNNADVMYRQDFKAAERVEAITEEGDIQVGYRPHRKSFLELRETNIEEYGPTTLKFSRMVNDEEKHLYIRYLVVHSMESVNYFPNFEWLYTLQTRLSFPISTSVRAYHQSNDRIVKRLSNKRLEYRDQKEEAMKADSSTDLALNQSEAGTIQAEAYFQKSGQPAYACSIVFKVTAENIKDLDVRSSELKQLLMNYGIQAVAPYGEQLTLMMEKILGSKQFTNDYQIEMDSGVLAGMMFGASSNIGDNRGFFIGYTHNLNKPVFIQPDLAAKAYEGIGNLEDSISALVAGATGKGKSFYMNLYMYLSVLTGSRALVIDPKGDRKGWKSLPLIPEEFISKWTLGSEEEDAGSLDPFRTSPSIDEAKTIAIDILSFLSNVDIDDFRYAILSSAVEFVASEEDPCLGAVIERIDKEFKTANIEQISEQRYKALEQLSEGLASFQKVHLAKLLVGQRHQKYKVLEINKPIQILMVENLELPDINANRTTKLLPKEKISEAILISITAFTKQYMFKQDRSIHKIVLQDEASSIDRNATGRKLMDFIVRKGRYYNTTLLKGSQNATDHKEDVANMGMKFSFGLRTRDEALEMLEFLNLPQTKANVDRIRELSRGNCIFQDIYGRSAVIKVDPVFPDLYSAFDSSTSSEAERERERNKKYGAPTVRENNRAVV
ncbi:AAA domain-containing protein [Ureibacillus xyleni]|uniref:AAA domain-containing protein n=1 Tax=Ureibacillus xyleni TaxID=614648 RepID=A0A285TH60_9BACL|nr:ATP-binding protein [Ureibacillus xyleni]SOC21545.1 AAA domain-containing protein [Ureibacillus xyleni]